MKLILGIAALSVLLAFSISPDSLGRVPYDSISEWGSFGIAKPGHFSHPQFIAVSNDGSVYVTDLGNKRVQKFASNGEYVAEWGQSGKQPGDFRYPSGIAVSDDSVFVADRSLNRVQKFTTDGEFVTQWGEKGKGDGQFYFPNGISVYNGTVYVVDTGNQRVQTFTTDGEFVSSFGSSGLGEGQFLTPVWIEIDADGNVYVIDKGNNKIEKFDSDWNMTESFVYDPDYFNFSPGAITTGPSGEIFIVNSAGQRISYLSENSTLNLNIRDQLGPYPNSFKDITDIAIGTNGELLVVDSAEHTIKSFETPFYERPPPDAVVLPEAKEDVPDDKTNPVIVAPASLIVDATDKLTPVSFGEANATDEGGIKAVINNAPDAFSPGVSTILWVAFDHAGYTSTATQTVTITTCGNAHSDYNIIEGTFEDDIIRGTDGDDLIFGLAGNDLIAGGLGNDCIFGGDGDDVVSGNGGNDTIRGNAGNDILKGQSGADIIYSNAGSDVIDGGTDSDRCYSSESRGITLGCEE